MRELVRVEFLSREVEGLDQTRPNTENLSPPQVEHGLPGAQGERTTWTNGPLVS